MNSANTNQQNPQYQQNLQNNNKNMQSIPRHVFDSADANQHNGKTSTTVNSAQANQANTQHINSEPKTNFRDPTTNLTPEQRQLRADWARRQATKAVTRPMWPLAIAAIGIGSIAYYWPQLSRPRHQTLHLANEVSATTTHALHNLEEQSNNLRKSLQNEHKKV